MNFPKIFIQYFFVQFLSLSTDKIVNVRILLAQILFKHFKKKGKFFFI